MTGLEQELARLSPYLQSYGYAAIFVMVFLESFGLPLPGESLIIGGALLASQGDLHIVPLLGAAWSAAVLGDNLGYALGHFGGRRLVVRYGARVGMTEARLHKVETFFRRYGAEVVLVARFFLILRQLNGVTAGTVAMAWHRFLLYNAVGAALWVGVWGLGVYHLGHRIASVLPWVHRLGYAAVALLGIAILVALVFRHFARRLGS